MLGTPKGAAKLDPAIIVIFGITGDLSQRYLLPSLYHLFKDGLLDERTTILGISRRASDTKALFEKVNLCINEVNQVCDKQALDQMHQQTQMLQLDLGTSDDYAKLADKLADIESKAGQCLNRLYYLSVPPRAYTNIIDQLGSKKLNGSCEHGKAQTRLMVEKPFGYDLESAKALMDEIGQVFDEEQIFRIDHYMAKEAVQNILSFRLRNPFFKEIWNNRSIESVKIIAKEQIGIEGRAGFYDSLGALRDFIQNHLIQMMAVLAMEQPDTLDSEHIHRAKQALLTQVETVPAASVDERARRGQYSGYREEVNNPESTTETLASVTLYIDNDSWRDVPFTLATGKALDERCTEVELVFKPGDESPSGRLRFRIQPDPGIDLTLTTKKPGYDYLTETTEMDFSYKKDFAGQPYPSAYERVLVDALRGDQALFSAGQEIIEGWRILQPVLEKWSQSAEDLQSYQPGSAEL